MRLTRREFLELSSGSLVYGFAFACGAPNNAAETVEVPKNQVANHALRYFADYTEWLFIHPDGSVTAHTGRTELGQGLTTVLLNLISQGLDLPPEKITIVMGDTDTCPDDGPTEGSSATRIVGWGYWHACERIRHDLVRRAAELLGRSEGSLEYRNAGVADKKNPAIRKNIQDLVEGTVQLTRMDPTILRAGEREYVDKGTAKANAEAIVTGGLKFAGDLFPGECHYGAYLMPIYHAQLTKVISADIGGAKRVEGVADATMSGQSAFVVGRSYTTVHRGLETLKAKWSVPERPKEMDNEKEIRAGAVLKKMIEEKGDPRAAPPEGAVSLAETYVTQYASQVPIETETAVAEVEGDAITVWASTQAPFKARSRTAKDLKVPEENVRIISMPVGGGFGLKVNSTAISEAAHMARHSGKIVKHVYSRPHQFVNRARYKESVVADISSVVTRDGKIISRTLDLHQDEGFGSTDTYDIPNVRTRLFQAKMPARHGTMRGTSFVQTGFAVESHMDMLAVKLGLDPIDLRKRNLKEKAFGPLLDACVEMVGPRRAELGPDQGVGFALCSHGGRQLGAVAAEVSVDKKTGHVEVRRLDGAFDIGLVINRNTVAATVKGAMMWGLGFALFEEVLVDGHAAYTTNFDSYRIPRFSDVPPIRLAFFDNAVKAKIPRGCGELPVIPTVGAIANAVYDAVGIRFHTLPLTPGRVLAALRQDS